MTYPRTYRTRRQLKVLFTVFGALMIACGLFLFWIVYISNFDGQRLQRTGPAGIIVFLIFFAGIAVGTFVIVSNTGVDQLVLYDDAIEQQWRFGNRRLLKSDIAYKAWRYYKVPYVVLVPRDKKLKKITLTPTAIVRDDAVDAWLNSIPSQQEWLARKDSN